MFVNAKHAHSLVGSPYGAAAGLNPCGLLQGSTLEQASIEKRGLAPRKNTYAPVAVHPPAPVYVV